MIHKTWINVLAAAVLCASLWGCSADDIPTPVPTDTQQTDKTDTLQAVVDELVAGLTANGGVAAVMGTDGGAVVDSASGAAIDIPAGALPAVDDDDAIVVSVVPYSGATLDAPADFTLAGDLFDINIQSARTKATLQPLLPVRITVPYATSVDSDHATLLALGNFHSSAWVVQTPEGVNTEAFLVTASFSTLSPFGALLRVNNPPTLSGLQLTTQVNTPVTGTLVGADVDGDTLSYSVTTGPSHGSVAVTASTGEFTYTPVTDFTGTDVFYVQVSDGVDHSDPAEVTVDVLGVIRYVSPSAVGSGDGSSWADATDSIQTAIDDVAAAGVGEVWVAQGTYRTTGTGPLITMADNVDLYGGFAGTEATLEERGVVDPGTTVLSGDSDSSGDFSVGDAYHVVVGASARLDGVTITGGNAVGGGSSSAGAGLRNTANGSTVTLANVHLVGNYAAADGGGIYNTQNLIILNSRIENNTAGSAAAGLFGYGGSVTMENSAVVGNTSGLNGGGMYLMFNATLTFRHGVIDGNSATQNGGGLYLSGAAATVVNSQISHNAAGTWRGGGIFSGNSSELVVTHSQFVGNHANDSGGAIALLSAPAFTLRNSSFWDNTAPGGKDVLNTPADAVFHTCAEQNLSGFGADNNTVTTSPFDTRAASGQYFFDPVHDCSTWGDSETATTLFSTTDTAWENWTSEISGEVVEGTTDGVAAGMLHHLEDVWIRTFEVTADTLSWLTNPSAESCRISNDADSDVVQLGASDLPSGTQGHELAGGTVVTMTCDSPRSYPKAAMGTVP